MNDTFTIETLDRYARIETGFHQTEGCGSIKPELLRFCVVYRSRAGECCEWYATLAQAETRLAEIQSLLTI